MPEYEQYKELFKIVTSIYNNYQEKINSLIINFEDERVAERISDYLYRSPHEYEAELIIRIPEFFTLGVKEELIKGYFADMIAFWKNYISPAVVEYLKENSVGHHGYVEIPELLDYSLNEDADKTSDIMI